MMRCGRGERTVVYAGEEDAFPEDKDVRRVQVAPDVAAISANAFSGCVNLREIDLADATTIGKGAFAGCKRLRNVDLRRVTEIEEEAFGGCAALLSVDLTNVTSIGKKSFDGCRKLKRVSVPSTVMDIGDYAFQNCSDLREVEICEGVQTIGWAAFWRCSKLKGVTIASTVTEIGGYAFSGCHQLEAADLPGGLEKIGWKAFKRCRKLECVVIPPTVTEIEMQAFADCTKILMIDLSEGLQKIGYGAFHRCRKLKSITIPSTVVEISSGLPDTRRGRLKGWRSYEVTSGAFEDCVNLKTVEFSEGLERIGNSAFRRCRKLKRVKIPSTVVEMSCRAFEDCSSLLTVNLPPELTKIDKGAFKGCRNLLEEVGEATPPITYRAHHLQSMNMIPLWMRGDGDRWTIYTGEEDDFRGRKDVHRVRVAPDVTVIRPNAFARCPRLTTVDLANATTIGKGSFRGCTMLREINLSRVNEIRDYAFDGCANLGSVDLGNASFIGTSSFEGCRKLKTASFPSSVINVGDRAFHRCAELQEVELSEGVQKIGGFAFQHCQRLKCVEIPSTVVEIGSGAFANCTNLLAVELSEGLQAMRDNVFHRCRKLQSAVIPPTVTKIGESAFGDCTNLSTVELSPGLTEIGREAFRRCRNLKRVSIPATVRDIEKWAFAGCQNLLEVELYAEGCEKMVFGEFHCYEDMIPDEGWATTFHQYAFDSCKKLEIVKLCEGIQLFDRYALSDGTFSGCRSLKQRIHVPSSTFAITKRREAVILDNIVIRDRCIFSRDGSIDLDSVWMIVSKCAKNMSVKGQAKARKNINRLIDGQRYSLDSGLPNWCLDYEIPSMFAHYGFFVEATSILELAIWKAKMDGSAQKTGRRTRGRRQKCRMNCGAQIIIPLVLPFIHKTWEVPVPSMERNVLLHYY